MNLGAMASTFHQNQQVAYSISGISLSNKLRIYNIVYHNLSQTLQNGEFYILSTTFLLVN